MNEQDILFFKENGYVIVEDVFSAAEIEEIRTKFHLRLKSIGIDHNGILEGTTPAPPEVRKKSPVADIFYDEFKMNAQAKVYNLSKSLMNATHSSGREPGFEHPFPVISEKVYPFIDHIGYRLPDHIRAESGLGMHIDRNPYAPFKNIKRFRPIQSFIALVDHYGNQSGGLQLSAGFHHRYDEYFKTITDSDEQSKGEFYRMAGKSHASVQKSLETLSVPKGSVVYWDNRLPHATCESFQGNDSREVIYFSYLPAVPINRDYCIDQLARMRRRQRPPAYSTTADAHELVFSDIDIDKPEYEIFRTFD